MIKGAGYSHEKRDRVFWIIWVTSVLLIAALTAVFTLCAFQALTMLRQSEQVGEQHALSMEVLADGVVVDTVAISLPGNLNWFHEFYSGSESLEIVVVSGDYSAGEKPRGTILAQITSKNVFIDEGEPVIFRTSIARGVFNIHDSMDREHLICDKADGCNSQWMIKLREANEPAHLD